MKKEWIKPEVSSLGMENTNEECSTFDEKGLFWHQCDYCGKKFPCDHKAEIAHEATCRKNPANQPAEGGGDLPTPALS